MAQVIQRDLSAVEDRTELAVRQTAKGCCQTFMGCDANQQVIAEVKFVSRDDFS